MTDLEEKSYTLYINSADKISGDNNNGSYSVNFASFLPEEYNFFKIKFTFQTIGGSYKDNFYNNVQYVFSTAKLIINFQGRNLSFDTSTQSQSNTLGFIHRDLQISAVNEALGGSFTVSNILCCSHVENAPKTISRPNQNVINVQIRNCYNNLLFTDTDGDGLTLSADMSAWNMTIEFIPIPSSRVV